MLKRATCNWHSDITWVSRNRVQSSSISQVLPDHCWSEPAPQHQKHVVEVETRTESERNLKRHLLLTTNMPLDIKVSSNRSHRHYMPAVQQQQHRRHSLEYERNSHIQKHVLLHKIFIDAYFHSHRVKHLTRNVWQSPACSIVVCPVQTHLQKLTWGLLDQSSPEFYQK